MPTTIVTHQYEFPSENPIATFGAGWTLVGSATRPLFFRVGSSLDDIIAQFNSWQDVGTEAPLTKRIVLHQIEYTRLYGTDIVTITYPMISSDTGPVIVVTGNVTTIEHAAFVSGTVGTGWVATNRVYHAVVTLTAATSRKRHTSTNPRFLCGLEAIDYVRTPGSIDIPPPPVTVPGAPVNIIAELMMDQLVPPVANFTGEIVPAVLLDTFSTPSAFWLADHEPEQYDPTAYTTDSGHMWFRNIAADSSFRDPTAAIMSVANDGFLTLGVPNDYYALSNYKLPPGDFYVELSFEQVQGSSTLLSIAFRVKDEPNPWLYTRNFADAAIRIDPGNTPGSGYYRFYHGGGSGSYNVTGDSPYVNNDLPIGTHTYRIEVIGDVVTTLFDGVPVLTGTIDVSGADFSTSGGYVGFGIVTYSTPHVNISKVSAGPL